MQDVNILFKIKSLHQGVMQGILKDESENEPIPRPTQMKILDYIIEHRDENIYQRDIEEMLKVSRATVSDVLQTMEKNGLIERVTSPNDSRVKQIILQDKAKSIFKRNYEKILKVNETIIKDISDEELQAFSKTLEKMVKNINENNSTT